MHAIIAKAIIACDLTCPTASAFFVKAYLPPGVIECRHRFCDDGIFYFLLSLPNLCALCDLCG